MKLIKKTLFLLFLTFFYCICEAHGSHGKSSKDLDSIIKNGKLFYDDGVINLDYLTYELNKCEVVHQLSHHEEHKDHAEINHDHADHVVPELALPFSLKKLFGRMFPFGPALNSVLAVSYIAGPANFIVSSMPINIHPLILTSLVSFAAGGLLGDIFLHLLPQTFLGDPNEKYDFQFVLLDEKRNVILGIFIFAGFIFFMLIDKTLRILGHNNGGDAHSHPHSHSHSHSHSLASNNEEVSFSSSVNKHSSGDSLSLRKKERKDQKASTKEKIVEDVASVSPSARTAAWLNLISDFVHNVADGIAITSAFYISKAVGSTTTLAIVLHEVPHAIGDFAVMIQGGFSKYQALKSSMITALGLFIGCLISNGLQMLAGLHLLLWSSGSETSEVVSHFSNGLFGTTVTFNELTLPFTAGGFIYIATVGVIPEVLELEDHTSKGYEMFKTIAQLISMLFGICLMWFISWFE